MLIYAVTLLLSLDCLWSFLILKFLYIPETLPRADGELTVYLGSSSFPPTSASSYIHCKSISTAVDDEWVTHTAECVVPIAPEYIYVVANGAGPQSICNVKALLAGKTQG